MKSVDRDFEPNGFMKIRWLIAYLFVAAGPIGMLVNKWDEIHLSGLSFHTLFQIVLLLLLFILPLIFAHLFRRYIRKALKEDLVSEKVAKNCEYWIGRLFFIVYFAFFGFSELLVRSRLW